MYDRPLKFSLLAARRFPNAVAVVVPARQPHSHGVSVGGRNPQPSGGLPSRRPSSVSLRLNSPASAKVTFPTGSSSRSGDSAAGPQGSEPTTRLDSPWEVSYVAVQKPLVSGTPT